MSGYNGSLGFATVTLILALMSAPAFGRDDLDVTMRLVGENEDVTESVAREIRLPELPALERRSSGPGDSEPPGQQIRDQAREKGRDFGQSMSERARDARGNRPERPGSDQRPAIDPGKKPELPPQSSRP
ncbi:hypothetical protein [Marinobacter nauticus]|jgi:hypothetical protein|uniref:hypothetical protein n=1 Tax=Marinobacter nauticus TaxID=2743 RepID=UPI002430E8ED|nr:hypothetical protein [Marinobacter nauticus]